MKNQNIRDNFWNVVYDEARINSNVVIVSADLAAPALDKFRIDLPSQYISVGIAEQNAMVVASGLALKGKKVFVYACSPFIFMRCYEQIKLAVAAPKLPITIVGQGTGLCYAESGVTHHSLEDIGSLRMLPNLEIFTLSDESCANKVAKYCLEGNGPTYVRIDRELPNEFYKTPEEVDIQCGFGVIKEGEKTLVISMGYMLQECYNNLDLDQVGLLDMFCIYPDQKRLIEKIKQYNKIITVEEHCINGGLGSYLCEVIMDHDLDIKVKRFGSKSLDGYCYKYGGRENLEKWYGVDFQEIQNAILEG